MPLLKDMTNQHVINAIKYWRRVLATKPAPQVYMGDGENGNDWVESENRQNDERADEITLNIEKLTREAKRRGIDFV